MKSVLLTNFQIKDFSGSEIDTLQIAKWFLEHGYETVHIFTLNKDNPLLTYVDQRIKIIDYFSQQELLKHYDLIWSHHYPLLDYLLFNLDLTANYIHYVSLSGYEPYECLPNYYQKLTYISILSEEAKNH